MDKDQVVQWLLDSDPSIRWQVMRDLQGAGEEELARERRKVAAEGWGARLLSYQDASGRWGGQLYGNKWLSTTYTLLLLRQMGLESHNPQAQRACKELLEGGFQKTGGVGYSKSADRVDNGVTGMILTLMAYFGYPDERIHRIAAYLLDQQQPNGSWEPVPGNNEIRYTFDATLLILEGLLEYERRYSKQSAQVKEAQRKGREFLLRHRLFKSIQSAENIHRNMTLFSFPPRWHYDVLAALDYFQDCRAGKDERLRDAIDLLKEKCNPDGRWNLQNRHAGKTFFEMEDVGQPSKWNTLRALRILKWHDSN